MLASALLLVLASTVPARTVECTRQTPPTYEQVVAAARRLHPEAMGTDSAAGTKLVGLVFDRECAVTLHAFTKPPRGSLGVADALRILFPQASLGPSEISGMTMVDREEASRTVIVWAVVSAR